jgi:Asp/Glu/hydantoin racemase
LVLVIGCNPLARVALVATQEVSSPINGGTSSSGAVERTARDIDIFEAKTVPPAPGRYRQAG